jgi:hypothetical protein
MISLDSIPLIFSEQRAAFESVRRAAVEAGKIIEAISPLIEFQTARICPDCSSVCCINRHSRFDRSDVIFMAALGKDIPTEDPGIAETDACKFLSERGCVRNRSQRPYRCTWFFCSALMDQIMQQASAAEYRRFIEMLRNITQIRTTMMNDFETISMNFSSLPRNPQTNK